MGWGVRFRREGTICVLVADSHCCMAEASPYCKAIIFQLLKKKKNPKIKSEASKAQRKKLPEDSPPTSPCYP